MDEFHPFAKPLPSLCQQLCDELLLWRIEIWVKNHLVGDNISNTINLKYELQENRFSYWY